MSVGIFRWAFYPLTTWVFVSIYILQFRIFRNKKKSYFLTVAYRWLTVTVFSFTDLWTFARVCFVLSKNLFVFEEGSNHRHYQYHHYVFVAVAAKIYIYSIVITDYYLGWYCLFSCWFPCFQVFKIRTCTSLKPTFAVRFKYLFNWCMFSYIINCCLRKCDISVLLSLIKNE